MDRERLFYWIVTHDPDNGTPILIAGSYDESEARQRGFDTLGGLEFEVKGLRTRNLQRASQMLRGVRLDQTHDIRKARQKIGHDRSLHRMLTKRRQHHFDS